MSVHAVSYKVKGSESACVHMHMDVHFCEITCQQQLRDYLLHWSMAYSEHNCLSYYPVERLTSSQSIP